MPRFLDSSTANLARSSCSGERYLGFRRLPHPMFTTYTPSARAWSISETILARVISPPFVNQRMAPYSRGGVLKFAAASRTGGTVICCHGLCAIKVRENSKGIANLDVTFINKPPSRCRRVTNPPVAVGTAVDPLPPARTRAGATNAHGSYLGYWRRHRSRDGAAASHPYLAASRTRSGPLGPKPGSVSGLG